MNMLYGHGRRSLFSRTNSLASQGSSVDFGQHDVGRYSRFTGMAYAHSGSVTLRYRMASQSGGPWLVSSTFTVNSGGNVLDFINYGHFVDFAITTINSSTTFSVVVHGEPIR